MEKAVIFAAWCLGFITPGYFYEQNLRIQSLKQKVYMQEMQMADTGGVCPNL